MQAQQQRLTINDSDETEPVLTTQLDLSHLESHLWEAANILRGPVDAADFKTYVFPLIHGTEARLTGPRPLPVQQTPQQHRFREADRYEMVGVIDVITHMELADLGVQVNLLVQTFLGALPQNPSGQFEVTIDYKGMRRPSVVAGAGGAPDYGNIYEWQVQTYAHLRSIHENNLPVVAGVIVHLNELLPTRGDIVSLKQEMQQGGTDIAPLPGSETAELLSAWHPGDPLPELPLMFHLQRALRVIEIRPETIQHALHAFDEVVARIEICRGTELSVGHVLTTWEKNATDDSTCARCDARTFCSSYQTENSPRLPGRRG